MSIGSPTFNKEVDKEIARAVVDDDEKLNTIFDEIDQKAEVGEFTQDETTRRSRSRAMDMKMSPKYVNGSHKNQQVSSLQICQITDLPVTQILQNSSNCLTEQIQYILSNTPTFKFNFQIKLNFFV